MLFELDGKTINGDDISQVGRVYADMSTNWAYITITFTIRMKNGEKHIVHGETEYFNWRKQKGHTNANDGGKGFVEYEKTEQYKKEVATLEERRKTVLENWNGSGEVVCV